MASDTEFTGNDFLGSFAQENVTFETQIIKSVSVGDNFWKVLIFVAEDQYLVEDPSTGTHWLKVPNVEGAYALSVNVDTYNTYTNGMLNTWLTDLFSNGFTGDAILVTTYTVGTSTERKMSKMAEVYDAMKAYAYHKTVCITEDNDGVERVVPELATYLAKLCTADYRLLSGCPLLPFDASVGTTLTDDPLYLAFTDSDADENSGYDAFFSAYWDTSRNGSLVSLGIALAETNGSGTCVGNGIDMTSTNNFMASGENGIDLGKSTRDVLEEYHIQTWKYVGDNSGDVAAYGEKTIQDNMYVADWIIAYITYMTKVGVAQLITSRNFLKNESNYSRILSTMNAYLGKFGDSGSGRLTGVETTAPAFADLPETDSEHISIPNAWTAKYVGRLAFVDISGSLYLGD